MRAPVALLAAATALSLLAPAAAQAAPTISKTKAQQLAKAGVLVKGDLKGYAAEKTTADPTDAADEKALYTCLGATVPKRAARNLGVAYSKDSLSINSSADVIDSPAAAKKDLAAIKSKKAAKCFQQQFATILERSGVTVQSLSVTPVNISVASASDVAGYRIRGDIRFTDIATRIDGYFLGILVGQTQLSLTSTRFDNGAASRRQIAALAEVVAKRVDNL
ncbi:MAG: hypothetical protein ACT4QG_12740 [Sporichthyaceae bacterium]